MEFTVTAGLLMTDTATTNTFPLATLLEKETEREGVALQPAKPDSSKQKAEFCWTRDDAAWTGNGSTNNRSANKPTSNGPATNLRRKIRHNNHTTW